MILLQISSIVPINSQTIDITQYVGTAVDQLVNTYSGLFLGMVESYLFWALVAGIVISGIHFLFVSPLQGMRVLWTTVFTYALAVWFLRYYDNPMPVIGIPFSQIFRMESRFLAAKIDISALNVFLGKAAAAVSGSNMQPSPFNVYETASYLIVFGSLALPEIILYAETSFAIIALGVGALLGSLFLFLWVLPFPWTKQLFWAWVHYMVKYSFYRVVASAIVFIWATAEVSFLSNVFNGQVSLGAAAATLLGLIVFSGVCVITCFRLSRLVSDLTSGQASAGGGIVSTATMAAVRFL